MYHYAYMNNEDNKISEKIAEVVSSFRDKINTEDMKDTDVNLMSIIRKLSKNRGKSISSNKSK